MANGSKNRAANLSFEGNISAEIKEIAAEVVTIDAGAQGAVINFQLQNFPIRNAKGGGVGSKSDTSLALTSLILTTEVEFGTPDASLAEGEFYVNYMTGEGRGKKASSSTTNGAATYKIAVTNISIDEVEIVASSVITDIRTPNGQSILDETLDTIKVSQATHDNLNLNANMQVANGDVPGNAGAANANTPRVAIGSTTPQALGTDATGADSYATVLTAGAAASHIDISNEGLNPAVVSLDGGATDHFRIPAQSFKIYDGVTIAAAANVQAKNGTAGLNYTGLYITIW